jgi:hypothetical protein
MQEEIWYNEIMDLDFKTIKGTDQVYFNMYGYPYEIITLKLTKTISIDWAKETRLCQMYRTDKQGWIKSKHQIKTLDELKKIINFFKA